MRRRRRPALPQPRAPPSATPVLHTAQHVQPQKSQCTVKRTTERGGAAARCSAAYAAEPLLRADAPVRAVCSCAWMRTRTCMPFDYLAYATLEIRQDSRMRLGHDHGLDHRHGHGQGHGRGRGRGRGRGMGRGRGRGRAHGSVGVRVSFAKPIEPPAHVRAQPWRQQRAGRELRPRAYHALPHLQDTVTQCSARLGRTRYVL